MAVTGEPLERMKNYVDIAIVGGGIAGLWTLARLRQAGYQAILLEADALACQQSGASQGIIHGGTKYALTGKLTHSALSIGKMPQRWQNCLQGDGEVDLRRAKVLSAHQYLWSNKSLSARLTGFFASKVMTSRMCHLSPQGYVAPFNQAAFNGELYQLDEPVLDIQSVVDTIRAQYQEHIFHAAITAITMPDNEHQNSGQLRCSDNSLIHCQSIILSAGAGNEKLLATMDVGAPKMQRRPLLMPMLRADETVLPRMYAHCLGASALPKMTITSHRLKIGDGRQMVWYLGGEIAESGVGLSIAEQVRRAKKELSALMPWMDFSLCRWSALAIDRAEPKMADGSRPVEPAVFLHHGVITAWPVKLAMAPLMVDAIVQKIEQLKIKKNARAVHMQTISSAPMTTADSAQLPWEKVEHWL